MDLSSKLISRKAKKKQKTDIYSDSIFTLNANQKTSNQSHRKAPKDPRSTQRGQPTHNKPDLSNHQPPQKQSKRHLLIPSGDLQFILCSNYRVMSHFDKLGISLRISPVSTESGETSKSAKIEVEGPPDHIRNIGANLREIVENEKRIRKIEQISNQRAFVGPDPHIRGDPNPFRQRSPYNPRISPSRYGLSNGFSGISRGHSFRGNYSPNPSFPRLTHSEHHPPPLRPNFNRPLKGYGQRSQFTQFGRQRHFGSENSGDPQPDCFGPIPNSPTNADLGANEQSQPPPTKMERDEVLKKGIGEESDETTRKSIWVPTEHVRYIFGPGKKVQERLERLGVEIKVVPGESKDGKPPKSTNLKIEGPSRHLKGIELDLMNMALNEISIEKMKRENFELNNTSEPLDQSIVSRGDYDHNNYTTYRGSPWSARRSSQNPHAPFPARHPSRFFSRRYPTKRFLPKPSPLNPLKPQTDQTELYRPTPLASEPSPQKLPKWEHFPRITAASYFPSSSAASPSSGPKTVKVPSLAVFRALSAFVQRHGVKNTAASADPAAIVFESPPDESFNESVLKLTEADGERLSDAFRHAEGELSAFLAAELNLSKAAVVVDHTRPPEPPRGDGDFLTDLGKISDFLSNLGTFDRGEIPGFGEVAEAAKSTAETEGNAPRKADARLSTWSEEAEALLRTRALREQLPAAARWLAQSKTFTSFVLGRLRALVLAIIERLAAVYALAAKMPGERAVSLESEKHFFAVLCQNLGEFGAEDRLELKTAIKKYPGHLLLDLDRFKNFKEDAAPEKQNGALSKKPKPVFTEKSAGNCRSCAIKDVVFFCNWCQREYCKNCLGNAQKPPCKSCQKNLTPFEKVVLYQSIPFEMGRERIVRSFGDKSDLKETSFLLPLYDPFSFQRIETPGKGRGCKHRNVFDIESFLLRLKATSGIECPICKKTLSENDLEIDRFIKRILATEPGDVREVTVQKDGSWTKLKQPEERGGECAQKARSDLKRPGEGDLPQSAPKRKKCIDLTF